MAQVTIAEVKEIIETSMTDAEITAFIAAASALVTSAIGSSTLVSADLSKEIERWLTAHLIAATRERQETQSAVGEISASYASLDYTGLKSTTYGQNVLMLDVSGTFASLGGKAASLKAITSFD